MKKYYPSPNPIKGCENYPSYDLTINQNHEDLKVLAKELDSIGIKYSESFTKEGIPELRGSGVAFNGGASGWKNGNLKAHSKDGNYIKVPQVSGWSDEDKRDIKDALNLASEKAVEYEFHFYDTSDQEWDDDRIWDASFTFFSYKKGEKDQIDHLTNLTHLYNGGNEAINMFEDDTDPAGGYGLASHE
tara:strand:+ start:290 stop:853 length:564 start_codon:yes stop_codon:yes gene_type:complete